MLELGNLAVVCAHRPDILLQIMDGKANVFCGSGPERKCLTADFRDNSEIRNIIYELNFGTLKTDDTTIPYFDGSAEQFNEKKLRLLLFEDCERGCDGCCNKDWNLKALPVCDSFKGYSLIMLTGGEPMLRPEVIFEAVKKIRLQTSAPIILYTALFTDKEMLGKVMDVIEGITATLHTEDDIAPFLEFDRYYKGRTGLSYRLNVFSGVGDVCCSDRWEIKDGMTWVSDCPLPSGEVFMRFEAAK